MRKSHLILFCTLIFLTAFNCKKAKEREVVEVEKIQNIAEDVFGYTADSTAVKRFTLTNQNKLEMQAISYGGIITSLKVPDRDGNLDDVVLGYDNLQAYIDNNPYFGAIIGRYGNRIANAKFSIDDVEYKLFSGKGGNHLHGGKVGFDKVVWNAKAFENENGVGIEFNRISEDGEEGYPGDLAVTVTYFLNNDNELEFDYRAKTNKPTVVNLTQHTYFNLTGMKEGILNHELVLNASKITPIDSGLIPTGETLAVAGTPFDFTQAKTVGQDILSEHEQMKFGGGFDHNWIINSTDDEMGFVGSLYESKSGRFMRIYTTEPGVQFYSGNFLNGVIGKNGIKYSRRFGLCLETQHYPDSPNKPQFPSTLLQPNEQYYTTTKYKFSVK